LQETADERWRPILGVEQILVSVIAMLNEPNISSPANVDAAVQVGPSCRKPGRYRFALAVLHQRALRLAALAPLRSLATRLRLQHSCPTRSASCSVPLQFRDDPKAYRRRVREIVGKTIE